MVMKIGLVKTLLVLCVVLFLGQGCQPSKGNVSDPSEPSEYSIQMISKPASIPADGVSQSIITIRVLNMLRQPVSGVLVVLSTNLGDLVTYGVDDEGDWEQTDRPLTSEQGIVYAILTSAQVPGTATLIGVVETASAVVYVNFV